MPRLIIMINKVSQITDTGQQLGNFEHCIFIAKQSQFCRKCGPMILFLQQISILTEQLGQNFLLVDLQEFFFRFRVEGTKKKRKKQSTGHFQSFFFSFSELFFFNTIKLVSKPTVCIKSLNISYFSCIGQSLLTVSLSKIHKQNLKNIFFFNETNNI